MTSEDLPSIAIIADAHLHDIESNYGFEGFNMDGRQVTLRCWVDTRRSSRVFNESKAALQHALNDIHVKNIRHVVLLGDYTDDGQIEASRKLVSLLDSHCKQYGTQFFAITGNHDAYGLSGKHQSSRFVSCASRTRLVTSDTKVASTEPESAVLTKNMYRKGVSDEIVTMAKYGLFRQPEYLHWETPFGLADAIDARMYTARSADGSQTQRLPDASYLVEPASGLWLLLIDANVFEPRNGQWKTTQKKAFIDYSDAGWNVVPRCRPHLLPWIRSVCDRANRLGKKLLCFSHYPIIDPFEDADNNLHRLFGNNDMCRRRPQEYVSAALMQTGMRHHFSAHLHVNAVSRRTVGSHQLDDCAVPSLAAFPAAYKIVHPGADKPDIDTIELASMSLDSLLLEYYRTEYDSHPDNSPDALVQHLENLALTSSNYGEFLYRRMNLRVIHHYLKNEWPAHIAESVLDTTAADLAMLMSFATTDCALGEHQEIAIVDREQQLNSLLADCSISSKDLAECSMIQLITDWYCLRHAGELARRYISAHNLRNYTWLAHNFGDSSAKDISHPRTFFAVFLDMLNTALTLSGPVASED